MQQVDYAFGIYVVSVVQIQNGTQNGLLKAPFCESPCMMTMLTWLLSSSYFAIYLGQQSWLF